MGKKNKKKATVVEPVGQSKLMAGFASMQKNDSSFEEETKEMFVPKQVAKPASVAQQQLKKPAYKFGGDSSDDEPFSSVQDKLRPQTASVAMTQPIVKQVQPAPQQKKAGFAPQQAKPAGFPSQPVRSSVLVPGKQITVRSNSYKLRLKENVSVWQYHVDIIGVQIEDAYLTQRIMNNQREKLELIFGRYICSQQQLFVMQPLEEDFSMKVVYNNTTFKIEILVKSQSLVYLDSQFKNEENQMNQNLLNIIIKQAFRQTDLRQLGRAPRFFDCEPKHMKILNELKLSIMAGFRASAIQSQMGCTLVVDSCFKFMSTQTCLQKMNELKTQAGGKVHIWQQMCRAEFVKKSIIAQWGNCRQYVVDDVVFDSNPRTKTFTDRKGKLTNVGEYFKNQYNKIVTQLDQPLFKTTAGQQEVYLPSEFCNLDGVSEAIRNGPKMRDALKQTQTTPAERLERIQNCVKQLFNQEAMKDWNLQMEMQPIELQTQVLPAPQVITGKQLIQFDERLLAKKAIHKAAELGYEQWCFVYEQKNEELANKISQMLTKASGQLGLKVQEPFWIPLRSEKGMREDLEYELKDYMTGGKSFQKPVIVMALLSFENNYPVFKEVCLKFQLPSQCITFKNARKFNLSTASNILRQVNSKAGGDIYGIAFPEAVAKKRTMLIGVDVSHAGQQSIVGLSASVNREMSQYYSDYFVQKKGQELVTSDMTQSIVKAIAVFTKNHQKQAPTNFVIYRDGVGDAQRSQVLAKEISQFEDAIKSVSNQASAQPQITVIFVNKKVSQRFFVYDPRTKQMANPPSGCIIDQGLVNPHSEPSQFDFYLLSANTNQGCATPVHFHVPKNDSTLTKAELQHLTFALCHFYFNWLGPIKVPAPCMYAHKIAEFYDSIKITNKKTAQILATAAQKATTGKPINETLHFL